MFTVSQFHITPSHPDFRLLLESLYTVGLHSHRTHYSTVLSCSHTDISLFPAFPNPPPLSPQHRASGRCCLSPGLHCGFSYISVKRGELVVLITVSPPEARKQKAVQEGHLVHRACHSFPAPAWSLQHLGVCPWFKSMCVPAGAPKCLLAYRAQS